MKPFIKTKNAYRVRGEVSEDDILSFARALIAKKFERGVELTSPDLAHEYFVHELVGYEQEVFGCLFLDNQHRVLLFEELFRGTVNEARIYPREIVKQALSCNAAAVICVHNHPSGDATPSQCDKDITKRINDALELVEVRLLDHLVVGGNDYVSLAKLGFV